MAVRNITATIVFLALIVFILSCGCSASKLAMDITDDAVIVTATDQATSMTMTTFTLEEDGAVYFESDLSEGDMSVTLSSTYGGEILFEENLKSQDSTMISANAGEYTLNITANKAIGTLTITDRDPKESN